VTEPRTGSIDEPKLQGREFHNDPDPMAPASSLLSWPEKWEYKTVIGPRELNLNELGNQGWELVSVTAYPGDQAAFHLKRPKR
jgi:hypothetical protein